MAPEAAHVYRPTDGSSEALLEDASRADGTRAAGQPFAWRAQRQMVADTLLLTLVEGLAVKTTGDQGGGGGNASE